jgi:ATP-dependent DNA helicase RecQ
VREAAETENLTAILASYDGDVCRRAPRTAAPRPGIRHKKPQPVVEEPPPGPAPPLPGIAFQTLRSEFSYSSFRHGQEEVVARVLNGESLLVVMPTGGGKSLCYQLPALLLPGITVVISPLIALMKDQLDGLPVSVREKATLVNSMLDSDELERRLRDIARGKYKLVYAAPERLRQEQFLHALDRAGVSLFVVDEVHCISVWGHDFRPDYLFIPKALERLGRPAFLGMTATATPAMRQEIRNQLGQPLLLVSTGTFRPNLHLEVRRMKSDEEKMRALIEICTSTGGAGIVYVTAREKAEELASLLRRKHVSACYYHAGMERESRDAAQEDFMRGRYRVVVATVAFGMGVDKSDVRFVVHYSLPRSLENYYQEAGRAGRDGKPSRCVLFYAPGDKSRLTRWMKEGRLSIDIVKSAYLSIKEQTGGRRGFISDDDIQRDAGVEETGARIALSLLERAGLIRRCLDLPRSITITAKPAAWQDRDFAPFAEAVRLTPDQMMAFDTFVLAERAGAHPSGLEGRLLSWRDEGLIRLHSSGRAPFVEIVPTRKSAAPLIREMLAAYEENCLAKIDDLIDYVGTSKCRHANIAEHFGEPPPEKCGACDICNRNPAAVSAAQVVASSRSPDALVAKPRVPDGDDLNKHDRMILDGVRLLPIRLGKRGLVRALKGSVACPIRRTNGSISARSTTCPSQRSRT